MSLFEKVRPVTASIFTWEQTTAFDGALSDRELRRRFCDEFPDFEGAERVAFWPLIAFNTSDGRKHRFLVAYPQKNLEEYRTSFDRCLPRQLLLYGVADAILRGKSDDNVKCDCVWKCDSIMECDGADLNDGNLLLTAIFEGKLYLLVFVAGRLCHWSEECGYESESPDLLSRLCLERVNRFRNFMAKDVFFSNVIAAAKSATCASSAETVAFSTATEMLPTAAATNEACSPPFKTCFLSHIEFDEKCFRQAAKDSFWHDLDLDKTACVKACVLRKRLLLLGVFLLLTAVISLYRPLIEPFVMLRLQNFLLKTAEENSASFVTNSVAVDSASAAVIATSAEDSLVSKYKPSSRTVDAYFLRGAPSPHRTSRRRRLQSQQQSSLPHSAFAKTAAVLRRNRCAKPDLVVNGIVAGRAILAEMDDEKKVLRLGDSVWNYRIQSIGRKDVQLECGRKKMLLETSKRQ